MYQGPKVSSLKVVLGSQKCLGISKSALGYQNVLDTVVYIVDIVDISESVDILGNLEQCYALIEAISKTLINES